MIIINKYKCAYALVPRCGSRTVCEHFANILDIKEEKWDSGKRRPSSTVVRWDFESTSPSRLAHIPEEVPENYYTFSFVRNPWARFASCYFIFLASIYYYYRNTPGSRKQAHDSIEHGSLTVEQALDLINPGSSQLAPKFVEDVKDNAYQLNKKFSMSPENYPSFEVFIDFVLNVELLHAKEANGHWAISQARTLRCHQSISDYNFIGRVETLEKDFKSVLSAIGAPTSNIPWAHAGPYYSDKRRDHVKFGKKKEVDKIIKKITKGRKNYKDFYTSQKQIDGIRKYYQEDIDEFKFTFEK